MKKETKHFAEDCVLHQLQQQQLQKQQRQPIIPPRPVLGQSSFNRVQERQPSTNAKVSENFEAHFIGQCIKALSDLLVDEKPDEKPEDEAPTKDQSHIEEDELWDQIS
ncbi:MAG: hypothetical protein OHK93_007213 [Ramalina farinacea]|uniref:Uncharacterized protein n=1 Tax=Ramalina farinacea TaxID=258253 RepID=A0AA43QM85_9LECA|nr:hypothetical protein [Ramalina farinacea]